MSAGQGYCWPSLGEPCGECHRCRPITTDELPSSEELQADLARTKTGRIDR